MWRKIIAALAAAAGAVASFFCGLPPMIWVLLAVMTIDYITGIICAVMGKSPKTEHGGLSSGEAFKGLLHKALILLVVLLAALLDRAVAQRLLPALLASAPVETLKQLPALLDELPASRALLRHPLPVMI